MTYTGIEFITGVILFQIEEYLETLKKIEAMMNWPAPRKLTDVISFLGLVGYCRKITEEYFPGKVEST